MSARGLLNLWAELRGIRSAPPPIQLRPTLPATDAPELEADAEDAGDAPPSWAPQSITGRTFVLAYADSKGQASERQVQCRQLAERAGTLYLHAFCFARERLRTFRADRIRTIMDTETGELFEPGMELLAHFLPNIVSKSRLHYGLPPQRFADFNAALNVLAFMARCDGHWHPLEAESIEDFAAGYWLRAEIDAPLDLGEVAHHVARLAPDAETFWVSLNRCAADPILSTIIRRHVSALIDADGEHHPLELYWGRQIDEFLSA